jgi:hypothetical protein
VIPLHIERLSERFALLLQYNIRLQNPFRAVKNWSMERKRNGPLYYARRWMESVAEIYILAELKCLFSPVYSIARGSLFILQIDSAIPLKGPNSSPLTQGITIFG